MGDPICKGGEVRSNQRFRPRETPRSWSRKTEKSEHLLQMGAQTAKGKKHRRHAERSREVCTEERVAEKRIEGLPVKVLIGGTKRMKRGKTSNSSTLGSSCLYPVE